MRLLTLEDDGSFSLEWFSKDSIPRYAILSHTWGRGKNDEVTYRDLVDGTGSSKTGYRKLKFCGEQAKADGLHYFWVDTCCIDKSNNSELTTAINSMFKWYQNAVRCYVYLSDVSVRVRDSQFEHIEWESAFRSSRWFTRGWTLQELLAPTVVSFYSSDEVRLGDKKTLGHQIFEVTGVPLDALRGRPLGDFTVEERFRWVERRETSEEEDVSYCLLGIFDVFLPLIYGEGAKNATDRLRREIQNRSRTESQPTCKSANPPWLMQQAGSGDSEPGPIRMMPFERNPLFTSRETELARLGGLLFQKDQSSYTAIYGLGGVGKTQLVIELIYRTVANHSDCSVFWIPAMDLDSLRRAYMSIAQRLALTGGDETGNSIEHLIHSYLSQDAAGKWLVVFDNADDVEMWIGRSNTQPDSHRLIDRLPRSKNGSIVFTTRDRKTAIKLANQNLVELREMDENAAEQLLQKHILNPNNLNRRKDTEALLSRLANLPIAVVQASSYINENGITITEYLSLFEEQEDDVIELLSEDFEDKGRYPNIKNPIATTWLISFETILRREPLAAEYLSFMACIEPKDIPMSILPPGPLRKKEVDAIGILDAYSFITKRPQEHSIDHHRLVHLATRNWLKRKGESREWATKTIKRLKDIFSECDTYNMNALEDLWRLRLPHAIRALSNNDAPKESEDWSDLAQTVAACLFTDGRHKEAEELQMKVVENFSRLLGAEHSKTLFSKRVTGLVIFNLGRWKEAEQLQVQLLKTSERVLGADARHTLHVKNDLAVCLTQQRRDKEADELRRQVIDVYKRILGEEHKDTLLVLSNLAGSLRNQGQLKEAEEIQVQILGTQKMKLGVEHPNTLGTMASLALNLKYQHRLKEAEELGQQALEGLRKVFGKSHPRTLNIFHNMAALCYAQGKLEEAIDMMKECVELRSRVLGPDHHETQNSVGYLNLMRSPQ